MSDSISDEEHLEDGSDEEEEEVSIWHPLSPVSSRPEARPAERCGHGESCWECAYRLVFCLEANSPSFCSNLKKITSNTFISI